MKAHEITFVIPFKNTCKTRLENFKYTIDRILQTPCRVIVMEHQTKHDDVLKYITQHSKSHQIKHVNHSTGDVFNKCVLMNKSINYIDTEYVWFNDSDCVLKFSSILDKRLPSCDVIQPFLCVKDTSYSQRRQLLTGKKVKITFTGDDAMDVRYIQMLGAQSFIIKKDVYVEIGGMDENFTEWGYEDHDFYYRVYKNNINYHVVHDSFGIHLYHKPSQENERNSEYLLKKHNKSYREIVHIQSQVLGVKYPSNNSSYIKRQLQIDELNPTTKQFKQLPDKKYRSSEKPKKIIHTCNLYDKLLNTDTLKNFETSLEHALEMNVSVDTRIVSVQSSEEEIFSNIKHQTYKPLRNSIDIVNDNRELMLIRDMLDYASSICDEDDVICYSNADLSLDSNIYNNIYDMNEDVIEYFRRDVRSLSKKDDYTIKSTGIDMFAIKNHVYKQYRHLIPEMFIGEPHWDTVLSGIFRKHHYTIQVDDMIYHKIHDQNWSVDNLSPAGLWNKEKYQEAIKYGVISNKIIRMYPEKLTILLDVDQQHSESEFVYKFSEEHQNNNNIVLIELLDSVDTPSKYDKSKIFNINHFPIYHTNENTKKICQVIPLINIATNMFSQNYKHVNVKKVGKTTMKTIYDIDVTEFNKTNCLEYEHDDINIFLNDHGLLESIK